MKKLLSCLLMAAMLLSAFAFAFAEEAPAVKSTTLFPCDENAIRIWAA